MILSEWDAIDFWDKLHLLLRSIVKSNRPAEGIKMVVSKGLFRKRKISKRRLSKSSSIIKKIIVLLNCIYFSCDQFELCIDILPRVVVNSHPATNICRSFVLIKGQGVVCAPAKASGTVSNLTVCGLHFGAPYIPMQGRSSKEAVRQGWKLYANNTIEYFDSKFCFHHNARFEAQKFARDSASGINHIHKDSNFLVYVFVQDAISVDQIPLKVLLVYTNTSWILNGFKGNSFSLDIVCDISKVKDGFTSVERNPAHIFDHRKIIVVNSNCQ